MFHDSVSTIFIYVCLDRRAPGPNSSNDNDFGLDLLASAVLELGLPEQIFSCAANR